MTANGILAPGAAGGEKAEAADWGEEGWSLSLIGEERGGVLSRSSLDVSSSKPVTELHFKVSRPIIEY